MTITLYGITDPGCAHRPNEDAFWIDQDLQAAIISDGMGLNVTVMSYRDSVDIGITADREQTPEVQEIVEFMHEELALLLGRIPRTVN